MFKKSFLFWEKVVVLSDFSQDILFDRELGSSGPRNSFDDDDDDVPTGSFENTIKP